MSGAVPGATLASVAIGALWDTVYSFTAGPKIEGGYSARNSDSGNWYGNTLIGSNHGISAPAAAAWLKAHDPTTKITAAWMQALSMDTAKLIAKHGYWDTIGLDLLAAVSHGLCLSVFDHGYNRGPQTAGRLFQALIAMPEKLHTGVVDSATIFAFTSYPTSALGKLLNHENTMKVQAAIGAKVDGSWGLATSAACQGTVARNIVTLYAFRDLQRMDYGALQGAKANPGWFTRADARLQAALALESHV